MKAVKAEKYGGPEVLKIVDLPKPFPKDGEVLVKVSYSTVNAGDSRMRSFTVPPLFWLIGRLALGVRKLRNDILGMEIAGIIESVGGNVKEFKPGDKVVASTFNSAFGGHAEYKTISVDDEVIVKVPIDIDMLEVVALPTGAKTALGLLKQTEIMPGQKVLIYGASGSIGTYAVQLAKNWGAEVTAVCSTKNVTLMKELGADRVIDYTQQDLRNVEVVYDVIFDTVSKLSFKSVKHLLKSNGYFVDSVVTIPSLTKFWYRITAGRQVIGKNTKPTKSELSELVQLVREGKLTTVVDDVYTLDQIVKAHEHVDTGHKVGNVIIKL